MYHYLIAEDTETVCQGLETRMKKFDQWHCAGFALHINQAKTLLATHRPPLLFLDWDLKGGSAFEVLDFLNMELKYNPYIIFNTGYQSENPSIPQNIINNYAIDKYLVKPYWEKLDTELEEYLKAAIVKHETQQPQIIGWLTDINGIHLKVNTTQLIAIVNNEDNQRCRNYYFADKPNPIIVKQTWDACWQWLNDNDVPYFATNKRAHIITKKFITKLNKPNIWLTGLPFKIEVVKENWNNFEAWFH